MGTSPFAVSPSAASFLPDSICPKGWELPRYKNDKSYLKLLVNVYGQQTGNPISNGDKGISRTPLSFLRSGAYLNNNGARIDRTSYGYYWGSRALSTTRAYSLNFNLTSILPQNVLDKGHGFSIRCVSK